MHLSADQGPNSQKLTKKAFKVKESWNPRVCTRTSNGIRMDPALEDLATNLVETMQTQEPETFQPESPEGRDLAQVRCRLSYSLSQESITSQLESTEDPVSTQEEKLYSSPD